MPPAANPDPALWPLALWLVAVAALMAVVIGLSSVIGQRSRARRRDLPYESGIAPASQPPLRFAVHFYLIALAFLVFDIEAAILLGWAAAARDLGWAGYIEALVFTIILFAGLVYLWAKGAFLWGVERE